MVAKFEIRPPSRIRLRLKFFQRYSLEGIFRETGEFGNKFGEGSSTSDFDRFLKRVTVFAWHTKCVSENVFWKRRHT